MPPWPMPGWGRPAKAEEKLNEALKIAPDSAAVLYNLGLIKGEKQEICRQRRRT